MKRKITGSLLALFFLSFTALPVKLKEPGLQTMQDTPLSRGKKVYTNVCLACHMADGAGVPNMNPPLIKTTYVLGDKTALIKIILNGFDEDVQINGQTYSNSMTSHSDLSDQQIADVLTYVRNSFGNKASAVTVAEVTRARRG
ncbi:MAG TPA: cytochrome c [Flavitalea sp.]|nr:cytochrome c [Flavitalea sp.]